MRLTHFPPGQNGRHFADYIFRYIFVNETFYILNKISLKFVPKRPIDKTPSFVQITAWRDKPLSEPMLTRFTDIYAALGGGGGGGGEGGGVIKGLALH